MMDRLANQLLFILEIDRLKSVYRRTYLVDGTRSENSAEHSWHLALMAMVLAEHANKPLDVGKVIRMVLIHDIVEIDAGDTYIYDEQGDKAEREQQAATRIFGLLPPDQEREFRELWEEFEAGETPEARFASALDRFMPQLHNYHTQGRSWKEHGITAERVLSRNVEIAGGSVTLWEFTQTLIEQAVAEGLFPES
jgi:5'-deoxynucleotidase YfbR-like HD superfamily hydrolase